MDDALSSCGVTVKQWNTVAVWSWNVHVETCAICKGSIADLCIECQGGGMHSRDVATAADGGAGETRRWPSQPANAGGGGGEDDFRMSATRPGAESGAADPSTVTRSPGMDRVVDTREAFDGAGCRVGWGVCSHAFHMHCISRWASLNRTCPVCGQEWELMKITTNN